MRLIPREAEEDIEEAEGDAYEDTEDEEGDQKEEEGGGKGGGSPEFLSCADLPGTSTAMTQRRNEDSDLKPCLRERNKESKKERKKRHERQERSQRKKDGLNSEKEFARYGKRHQELPSQLRSLSVLVSSFFSVSSKKTSLVSLPL